MHPFTLENASEAVARANSDRDAVLVVAYECLLAHRPLLASALLERLDTPLRVARWLASRQRGMPHGRTPWDLLSEGDDDAVWDALDCARSRLEAGG